MASEFLSTLIYCLPGAAILVWLCCGLTGCRRTAFAGAFAAYLPLALIMFGAAGWLYAAAAFAVCTLIDTLRLAARSARGSPQIA